MRTDSWDEGLGPSSAGEVTGPPPHTEFAANSRDVASRAKFRAARGHLDEARKNERVDDRQRRGLAEQDTALREGTTAAPDQRGEEGPLRSRHG